jgi:hypothetical protein
MKGGVEWNSAWGISFEDREMMIKVIKEQNPSDKEYL